MNTAGLTPRRPELRGTCERAAKAAARQNPTLRVVRGWYNDAVWGAQEHWWCVGDGGAIIDPTVEQFPTGHIPFLRSYTEFTGTYPCAGCGTPTENTTTGFCCGACYGNIVGIYIGPCRCDEEPSHQPPKEEHL